MQTYDWRHTGDACGDGALHQPEAFASDLGDDQSRHLLYKIVYKCNGVRCGRAEEALVWTRQATSQKSRLRDDGWRSPTLQLGPRHYDLLNLTQLH